MRTFLAVLVLGVCLLCGFASASDVAIPTFQIAQPRPCGCLFNTSRTNVSLNQTCAALLAVQTNGTNKCAYPYPESLGIKLQCVNLLGSWFWTPLAGVVDVFVPNNVLVDFCLANFYVPGQLLIPPSSNLSIWRNVDGLPLVGNATANQYVGIVVAGGTIYNYGYTFITLNNLTNSTVQPPITPSAYQITIPSNNTVPANNVNLLSLYLSSGIDLSNRTQIWQSGEPRIKCQTLNFNYTQFCLAGSSFDDLRQVNCTVPGRFIATNLILGVFDQCSYDTRIFVIVVATVGGSIILATIILALVGVIKAIIASKEAHESGPTYVEMDRS